MIVYAKKEDCCGCTACMSICPNDAITMVADEEGFLYPHINDDLCNECQLCIQICPFREGYRIKDNYDQPIVYAAKHRDYNVRINSSSGGMFTAISDYILDNGGVIYGVAFDDKLRACHQKAETPEERDKLRGSKYVQSYLNGVFKDVREKLKRGKPVLFTGTPCQNAGLHAYLKKDYENLYLCDIVCRGTPSPVIFQDYIRYCEKKNRSKVIEYYCRYKGNGWHSSMEKAVYENGKEDSTSVISQLYRSLFYSLTVLRPACHNCKFANVSRPSDITIGDFWGIEKCMPDFDDNMGVSLVLVNSAKGMNLFQKISKNLGYRESTIRDCLQWNLHTPTALSPQRDQFWKDYWDRGFEFVLKQYAGYSLWGQLKAKVIKPIFEKAGLITFVRRISDVFNK